MKKSLQGFFLITLILLFCEPVIAQTVGTGVLNTITGNFASAASKWKGKFTTAAEFIFFSLALISLVWHIGQLALKGFEITELFTEIIRFVVITGLFYVLLMHGPEITTDIFNGLQKLAGQAGSVGGLTGTDEEGNLNQNLTPSGIIASSLNIFQAILESMPSGISNLHTSLLMGICGLALILLSTIIAVNLTLIICSGYILAYAGIILLGFGGMRFTSDIALNYLKTVISIGLQLMTLILIVMLGKAFTQEVIQQTQYQFQNLGNILLILVSMFIVMYLALKLPPIVAGIITGASIGGTAGLGAGWGSMMAAAGTAGAAAAAMYNKMGSSSDSGNKSGGNALTNAAGSMAMNAIGTASAFRQALGGGSSGGSSSGGEKRPGADTSAFGSGRSLGDATPDKKEGGGVSSVLGSSSGSNNSSATLSNSNSGNFASTGSPNAGNNSGGGTGSAQSSGGTSDSASNLASTNASGLSSMANQSSTSSNSIGTSSSSTSSGSESAGSSSSSGSHSSSSAAIAEPSQGSVTGTVTPVSSSGDFAAMSGSSGSSSSSPTPGQTISTLGRVAGAAGMVAKTTANMAGQSLMTLSRNKIMTPIQQRADSIKNNFIQARNNTFMFKVSDSIKNQLKKE